MDMDYRHDIRGVQASPSYETKMDEIRRKISMLPAHTDREIEWTARRLEMQQVRFEMGSIDLDLFRMTKEDLLGYLSSLESWSAERAMENRNLEPPYPGGDRNDYARRVKLGLAEFLYGKFEFLSRLRSDDPDAWDTINELYYND